MANRILVRGVVLAPAEGGDVQRFAFEEGEEHKRDFLIAVASEKATLSWSRKHRRFPLRVPARFVVEGKTDEKLTIEGDGHIEDVGSGGASIKTTEPLPDGAKVTVELDSGDGLGKIEFTGKVVWSEKDDASAGIGIQFERLGGDEMKQLRRMIRDVKIHGKTIEGSD